MYIVYFFDINKLMIASTQQCLDFDLSNYERCQIIYANFKTKIPATTAHMKPEDGVSSISVRTNMLNHFKSVLEQCKQKKMYYQVFRDKKMNPTMIVSFTQHVVWRPIKRRSKHEWKFTVGKGRRPQATGKPHHKVVHICFPFNWRNTT